MISPGQIHSSTNIKNNIRIITFNTEFVVYGDSERKLLVWTFCCRNQMTPYIDTNGEAADRLAVLLGFIEKESQSQAPNSALMESLLVSFLHYVHRYSDSNDGLAEVGNPRVSRLLDLVEKHYKTEKKCAFHSGAMSMTNKRLNQVSKEFLGKTVTSLVHERLLLEARRELKFSAKTVKAIALDLGLDDPSYFGRFFIKQTDESPMDFRIRMYR